MTISTKKASQLEPVRLSLFVRMDIISFLPIGIISYVRCVFNMHKIMFLIVKNKRRKFVDFQKIPIYNFIK